MADLISRDALNEALSDWNLMIILSAEEAQKTGEWRVVMPRVEVLRRLMNAPAVDAEPVVHARWACDEDFNIVCTGCGKRIPTFHCYNEETYEEWDEPIDKTPYCPNCGAKMDGGVSYEAD